MNTILAIVVTYNRKDMLEKNIEALSEQSYSDFDVLIVDNASTDGTYDCIKDKLNGKIDYINTKKNLGGAGGFNFGIKEAIIRGYEYCWIMDDDTFPTKEALSSLVKKSEYLESEFSFLCSLAKFDDLELCKMNKPKIAEDWVDNYKHIENNLIKVESCSFVSCFINLKFSKVIGLPIKEFFIYGDDVEYTLRLSKKEAGYIDLDSIVYHKMKNNSNTDIVAVEPERISRAFYTIRNRFYIAKKAGNKEKIKYILKVVYLMLKILIKAKNNKMKRLGTVIKGLFAGFFFNPQVEYVDESSTK